MINVLRFATPVLLLSALLLSGCGSTIQVHLVEPVDGKMFYSGDEYTFGLDRPGSVVKLKQWAPHNAGKDDAEDIEFEFPDPDAPGRIIPAKGFLYVYVVELDDVAMLARNDLVVTDDQVRLLKSGSVLTLRGYDPSGTTLYRVVIGMKP